MKKFLLAMLLCCQFGLKSEVYDCFPFLNELELLHMRFDELNDVVDYFVIVEGKVSYTGKEKSLCFLENAHQFSKYKDKIIHVVIEEFPGLEGKDANDDHWKREIYTRNVVLDALEGCDDDDLIFISDVDEIPSADVVQKIQKFFDKSLSTARGNRRSSTPENLDRFVVNLDMRLLMYQLNRENFTGWIGGSKAAPYWVVKKLKPWGIKLLHHTKNLRSFENAGWHFNTMGGQDRALYKWLQTGPLFDNEESLLELGRNENLLNASYQGQVKSNTIAVPVDNGFPRYMIENLEYFKSIGWIAEY